MSGFPTVSYLSELSHPGPPDIWLAWTLKPSLIIQLTVTAVVVTSSPRIPYPPRGASGRVGLIVATANSGFAFAGILLGADGGSGIAHAVCSVARTRFNGLPLPPCENLPLIVLLSLSRVPSNSALNAGMESLTAEPLTVAVAAVGVDSWSML